MRAIFTFNISLCFGSLVEALQRENFSLINLFPLWIAAHQMKLRNAAREEVDAKYVEPRKNEKRPTKS